LNLGSDAPQLFKALVEATCFGSKAIVNRFTDEGIPVKGIIALGGVAKKSQYVMQTMANILEQPIRIHQSDQTVLVVQECLPQLQQVYIIKWKMQ
jgi:L-ribulokinase